MTEETMYSMFMEGTGHLMHHDETTSKRCHFIPPIQSYNVKSI